MILRRSISLCLVASVAAISLTTLSACRKVVTTAGTSGTTVSDSTILNSAGSVVSGASSKVSGVSGANSGKSGTSGAGNNTVSTGSVDSAARQINSTAPTKILPSTKANLTLWWPSTTDDSILLAKKDYAALYPNVTINVKTPMSGITYSSVQSAIAAGTQPDLLYMDHVYIASMGKHGSLYDLTQFGANTAAVKNKYIPACWNGVTYNNGKALYGLPHDGNTIVMYVDTTLLPKNQQTSAVAPTNYNQLVTLGKKYEAAGSMGFTFPFGLSTGDQGRQNWEAFNFFMWLWGCGGEILNSTDTKAAFNSASGVEALTKIVALARTDNITDNKYHEDGFTSPQPTVGMIFDGNWQDDLLGSGNTTKYTVAMLPTIGDVKPYDQHPTNYSGLGLFAVSVMETNYLKSNNTAARAAVNFLEFLTMGDKYELYYCQSNNQLPVTESALSNSKYQTAEWQTYIKQYKLSKARPGITNWDEVESDVAKAVDAAVGGTDPQNALNTAANQVNTAILGN
jgi:multiple sugar transport system substrate-binding protein